MYQSGRADEKVKHQQEAIDTAHAVIARLEVRGSKQDTAIQKLRLDVANAKAKVVYVDRVHVPSIDSGLATVKAQLDSVGRLALAEVVNGYEARLAARDQQIASMDSLINTQDVLVGLQREIIKVQKQVDSTYAEMADELKKLSRPSFFSRVLNAAVPVATLVLVIIKG